jgi:hypothetical protein
VREAFVSSGSYTGSGVGGALAADALCEGLAQDAGLPKGWTAWVSSTTTNAVDRVVLGTDSIKLLNGTTVIASGTTLVITGPTGNINLDEHQVTHSGAMIWTGTSGAGDATSGETCGDWKSESGKGTFGLNSQLGSAWTDNGSADCTGGYRLYCFGP